MKKKIKYRDLTIKLEVGGDYALRDYYGQVSFHGKYLGIITDENLANDNEIELLYFEMIENKHSKFAGVIPEITLEDNRIDVSLVIYYYGESLDTLKRVNNGEREVPKWSLCER